MLIPSRFIKWRAALMELAVQDLKMKDATEVIKLQPKATWALRNRGLIHAAMQDQDWRAHLADPGE